MGGAGVADLIGKAKEYLDLDSQAVRRVVTVLIGTALLLMLPACGSRDSKDVPTGVPWTSSDIIGYRFVRIHPEAVEEYRFNVGGIAAVTMGSKNGPVAAPLMHWRIDERGVLRLGIMPGGQDMSLFKLEVSEHRAVAMVSGERREYTRTKVK